jgi:hypothetical protein
MGILLNSIIFLMLPSAVMGILTACGIMIFRQLGPFYSFCLLCAGFTNSIVYLTLHHELKNEAKRLINYKTIKVQSTSINPHILFIINNFCIYVVADPENQLILIWLTDPETS